MKIQIHVSVLPISRPCSSNLMFTVCLVAMGCLETRLETLYMLMLQPVILACAKSVGLAVHAVHAKSVENTVEYLFKSSNSMHMIPK